MTIATDAPELGSARVSTWDVLVSLGFAPDDSEVGRGYSFDFGNFKLWALPCVNRWFADIVLLTGHAWIGRGTLVDLKDELPAFVESRETALAYLVSSLDRSCQPFTPLRDVSWIEEGRANKLLVPWERMRAEALAKQAEYAARPRCHVEREWIKVALRTLQRRLGNIDSKAVMDVIFDGRALTFQSNDIFCTMPAQGHAWSAPAQVRAPSLTVAPKRLPSHVEVMVGREALYIHQQAYPLVGVEPESTERGESDD